MRIDTAAYASRWRNVDPSAKALFALAGMGAAYLAQHAAALAALCVVLALVTWLGARVPLRTYLAVVMAPLGFLLLSCATMLVGPGVDGAWHWQAALLPATLCLALRSLAVLAALLALVLTTPMPDLLMLLRRVRMPALLLDLMVLCYRMLFVLHQAWEEGITAQNARLGNGGWRQRWRSIGLLTGQMAVQVWQRAAALQMALDARACQGQMHLMPTNYPQARRQTGIAICAGVVLLGLAWADRV